MADLECALREREAVEHRLRQEMEERRRIEIELRQAQKLQAVGQLAAGIAHEINTPAQFVTDNVRFLSDSFESLLRLLGTYQESVAALVAASGCDSLASELRRAEEAADLAYISENSPRAFEGALDGMSRISKLVEAMKEFAHAEGQGKRPEDLNRALKATLAIAHNEYKYVADLEMELGDLPLVTCNIGEMNQVFLNLLVNAAHAVAEVVGNSGKKGLISVKTAGEEDNKVRIEIADNGCGIPENIRERVFEPFFTTKEVGKGSGQGLTIARSIVVNKHGGSLTFESEVGRGTRFVMLLPIS
jgi:signal transduction histidine kinase